LPQAVSACGACRGTIAAHSANFRTLASVTMMSRCMLVVVVWQLAELSTAMQQHVHANIQSREEHVGSTAELTEVGYQLVAAQRDNDEMKAFIHRVLEAEGLYAADKGELNGLVKYYSGAHGPGRIQSLEGLKQELRHAHWVNQGEGWTAALSEVGYQNVAGHRSRAHMTAFARRILKEEHKNVVDEGALAGLVPYHSGEISVQSFDKLRQDLLSADWVKDAEAETPLTESGYQLVALRKSDDEMMAFAHRVAESEARHVGNTTELNRLVPYYSGTKGVQSLEALKQELRQAWWVHPGEGRTAALSEVGYQNVSRRSSRAHMTAFARRILKEENKKVVDEGALAGLVPYHSGEISVQSFDKLKQDLLSADWVKDAELAPTDSA